jgi:hypothetical protein
MSGCTVAEVLNLDKSDRLRFDAMLHKMEGPSALPLITIGET